ncbi:hypothetical protein GBT19_26545 [Escherichia coli]|nr:hypothetical protein [Escherichia coli]EEY7576207.1 hypothetical protein [Escherichia coli]EEY7645642.1 hypothetical protein [Escherichia coli]EEY8306123.1 hypothetical protein [Escherichia coli]EFB6903059.1 hypothetical protein [Escherichia coli]
MSIFCACPVHGKHVFIFFIWLTCRETGHGSRKIFINSENPRGRRPVTGRIAGKDPRNDNYYHLYKVYHNMCVRHQTTRNNQL